MGRVSQKGRQGGGALTRELVQENQGYRGQVGGVEWKEEDGIGVRA